MEKLTTVSNFTKTVELLRNTECSRKEKLNYFHQISEHMISPSMTSHTNFSKHCSSATSVLLFFCEDLDSVVRMNAEENLNKIFRSLETHRSSRILLDLFGEIRKNGNERSLRICLNLFSYYCPRIKEKNVKWYALKILPCLQVIALRKETLLMLTLCEFVKSFSKNLQICLNDNETVKLIEVFLSSITSDCVVKRRCSSANCLNLIENARNKGSMAKYSLNKSLEFLINDQNTNTILGVLGFLRLLLPIIIVEQICDYKQILEIYDVCLHLLNNENHSIINASLEVINSMLSQRNGEFEKVLSSQQQQNHEFLKRRRSLKNQIFQLKNTEMMMCNESAKEVSSAAIVGGDKEKLRHDVGGGASTLKKHPSPSRKSTSEAPGDAFKLEKEVVCTAIGEDKDTIGIRFEIKDAEDRSECNNFTSIAAGDGGATAPANAGENLNIKVGFYDISYGDGGGGGGGNGDDAYDDEDLKNTIVVKRAEKLGQYTYTTSSESNEPQDESLLTAEGRNDDKLQVLSDIDNESFNSMDFESEIAFGGEKDINVTVISKNEKETELKPQKSTDSIGSFFNNLISHSNAETMTKLFRPSTKFISSATESLTMTTTASTPKSKESNEKLTTKLQPHLPQVSTATTTTIGSTTSHSTTTTTTTPNVTEIQTMDGDTISLESINSHISLASHVSFQGSTQDLLRNEQDLLLVHHSNNNNNNNNSNEYDSGKNLEIFGDYGGHIGAIDSPAGKPTTISTEMTDTEKMQRNLIAGDNSCCSSDEKDIKSNDCHVKIDIGTIYDQPIIFYTVRLIASKFLLNGIPNGIISDTVVRVSIKNLSLNVIANCVRLKPNILACTMEIDKSKIGKIEEFVGSSIEDSNENISNELGNDFTIPDDADDDVDDDIEKVHDFCQTGTSPNKISPMEGIKSTGNDLLEIKDDHFGESNTMLFLNSPLSKSADPVLMKNSKFSSGNIRGDNEQHQRTDLNNQFEKILCKSEILKSDSYLKQTRKAKLLSASPKKSEYLTLGLGRPQSEQLVKANSSASLSEKVNVNESEDKKQFIYDVLLFYNHPDPILRGNVQIIVRNFISAVSLTILKENKANLIGLDALDFNRLLAIIVKGFRDEIHTVVIQALTSFDRIFTFLMLNHFVKLKGNQGELFIYDDHDDDDDDDDVFVENILNCTTNVKCEKSKKLLQSKIITPKFFLNQLRLCYHNKYWLVQNKYAKVISNLNLNVIRECCGDDVARSYENAFLDELLKLLGDDDFRIRENSAECLCRYVKVEQETRDINLTLIQEFLDYRIFQGMSKLLRNLFNEKQFDCKFELTERRLAKVLYLLTNNLMELHKKNLQFGIINAIKVLANKFNPMDYYNAWSEFNLAEVCLKFALQNPATAMDLNCQSDLIEITVKLLAADILHEKGNQHFMETLFGHIMKILNIYYHLFSNQRPILFSKTQKTDLFTNTKEHATMGNVGYFGNDYLYIKLYNILKGVYESYKITINQESGVKLMSLITICLSALSILLELQEHSKQINVIKLIEEILQYLNVLINYEPVEAIDCLRQLLKFLFGRNYANRHKDYDNFTQLYFNVRRRKGNVNPVVKSISAEEKKENVDSMKRDSVKSEKENADLKNDDAENFQDLFANAMNFPLGKVKSEEECARHIKLFEPLVIYCLTLFMKSNAVVQGPILELLSQLLEFNVTYSILDSKNVIFDNVMKSLELIENGIARNSTIIIGAIIKFLVNLTKQNNSKLITIPKIISVINNMLANNSIEECSVLALKFLTFEVFFNNASTNHSDYSDGGGSGNGGGGNSSLLAQELSTQKEVILGILEKFIGYIECQKTLSILLLWNKSRMDTMPSLIQDDTVYSMVTKGIIVRKIKVQNFEAFSVLESLFKNCEKNVLFNTKEFSSLLSLFMNKNIENFNDLSYVSIILDKIILNAEEIYLGNQIKLFAKNHQQCELSENEINYFVKVLYEKVNLCFSTLIQWESVSDFSSLTIEFIRSLRKISTKDGINSIFRRDFIENFIYGKYGENLLYMECLQVEIMKLACNINLDKILILSQLEKIEKGSTMRNVILKEICLKYNDPEQWTVNEIEILFSQEFLLDLVNGSYKLIESLCHISTYGHLFLKNLLDCVPDIQNETVPFVLKLINTVNKNPIKGEILLKLYHKIKKKKLLKTHTERALLKEITDYPEGVHTKSIEKLLSENNSLKTNFTDIKIDKADINETWMIDQIIKMSSTQNPEEYVRILLDIKSEIKLKTIFNSANFNINNVLKSCIDISFEAMILSFQNDCIQFNPHVNYLNMNALAKISVNSLIKELQDITTLDHVTDQKEKSQKYSLVSTALSSLFIKIDKLKNIGLIYVEYKFIERFIKEQIFKSGTCIELIIDFLNLCCDYAREILSSNAEGERCKRTFELNNYFICIDKILQQEFIWLELNQPEKYVPHLNMILDMVHISMKKSIRNTIFYKRYKSLVDGCCNRNGIDAQGGGGGGGGDDEDENLVEIIQKAIFIAKLIETKIDFDFDFEISSMRILKSIAIALFRLDQFYVYAVTPLEIFQSCGWDRYLKSGSGSGGAASKLPSIPIEHLSDADILQKFVKRLFIFGFSTRQQFEEYFMTFLLLINKTYDENMVDVQEQYQIKSTCLGAILELLIMCHTFPIIGNRFSWFHHTTRWLQLKCDNISSKKLHKIQILIPNSNAFTHPNSERDLRNNLNNVIGTTSFLTNQYGLNFLWQQMENSLKEENITFDVHTKNIRYFMDMSGIDLKSSFQLIYDVLSELIEQNHILVLPNLVKFCEICDNRDQIKGIKDKITKLQEAVAIDDTISHQFIIYLLCKTQSILVPSYSELSHLCSIISTYLKSSHVFIRNATLHGLLCLLECCAKTSTTIGKLSDELTILRDLIVNYITRHGIIEESSLLFSDVHTKLVWALNFSLIEKTTKFVPECTLLPNSIISANNLLKRTTNENVYLCILHGIERIIISNNPPQPMCDKIEKLALELVKLENERFSLPALKLLLTCIYMGSSAQLENTELSNGIVQDDPEIIAQQTEKVDILLHCIKSSTSSAAKIYGEVLCQIIRDLVPPNEILTKVIKEFLAINQPHCEVIAKIVHQVFRSAIDSSFLQLLQDWLICSLPTFASLPEEKSVWYLTIIFISASINLHLIKLFPIVLYDYCKLDDSGITLFLTSARDFYERLSVEQKKRFRESFNQCGGEMNIFKLMLKEL